MRRIYAEMRTSMSKNEEQLVKLVKDVISGASDKEQFCKEFFDEVYALVYPVFGTENSKKVTNRALIYLCGNIDKINTDKNIHRQIATEVSVFMFGLIDTRTIKKAGTDISYEYNRIKEDGQLYELIKNNVRIFRNTKAYDDADESVQDLSRVQTILLELYGYEMHSVQEISSMLNVEEIFVSGMLAKTKAALFGMDIEDSVDEQPEDGQEADAEEYEEESISSGNVQPEDEQPENDAEEITDEEAYFVDDDIDFDDRSDENPFRKRTKQEEAEAIRRSDAANPVVKALAGVIGKLFPDLSQTARRIVVYVAGGVVMFAIVLSIFLSVILSTSFTSAKKNNAGNFKITMAETSSSKENTTKEKTTKKSKTDTGNDNNAGNNDNNNSNNSNRNNSDNKKDTDKEEESEEETEETTQEETTEEESSQKETETATKDSDNKTEETSSADNNGEDGSQSTEATNATEESTTKAATTDTKADTDNGGANNGGADNGVNSVNENGGNKLN